MIIVDNDDQNNLTRFEVFQDGYWQHSCTLAYSISGVWKISQKWGTAPEEGAKTDYFTRFFPKAA